MYIYFLGIFQKKKCEKKTMNEKRKKKKNLNWATAHLNLSIGSRYSHCIVTPMLVWPGGG